MIIHGAEIYRQAALSSVDVNSASRKAEKTYVNYSPEISKISGLFSAMGVWKKQREIDSRLFGSMIRTKLVATLQAEILILAIKQLQYGAPQNMCRKIGTLDK